MPSSLTDDDDLAVVAAPRAMRMIAPLWEYFDALLIRLAKTWASRIGSA